MENVTKKPNTFPAQPDQMMIWLRFLAPDKEIIMIKNIFIATLGFALLATTQGYASALNNETIPGIMKKIDVIRQNDVDLSGELPSLGTAVNNATKKASLWKTELNGRITNNVKSYTIRANRSLSNEKRLTIEINRHVSSCHGRSRIPTAPSAKCVSEHPMLQSARTNHINERYALIKEKKVNDAEWARYANLYNDEMATINKGQARRAVIRTALARHKRELNSYLTQLSNICLNAQRQNIDEVLHHCYSIHWDGARVRLPLLGQFPYRGTKTLR